MKKSPNFEEIAGFNDRWMIAVGLPMASVVVSLLLFADAYEQGEWGFVSICMAMSFIYTGLFWAGMRRTYMLLKIRYPLISQIPHRAIGAFLGFNLIYVLVNFSLDNLFLWTGLSHSKPPNPIVEYIASLILSALVITLYEAVGFHTQLERTVAEKAQLERQNVESQLEGLRNQVNPHFLFNSLNTLIYLIPEAPEKAVNFVQKLSKVYRYVLESRDAKIIPLAEEMEFLKAYTFLLKERFGDNLHVKINGLAAQEDTAIVPLSLQMLFENAIKHNVISVEKPLTIEVFTENGHLVVRNNLQKKNQVMDSTGVGLSNVRDRYKMLAGKEVEVIASHEYFTVLLPIVKI